MKLLDTEIDFIPNPEFRSADAHDEILAELGHMPGKATKREEIPQGLPSHLARLCETPLLSAEQERSLFRRMNYLKFRANALRSRIDPDNLDAELVQRAEWYLAEAAETQNRIVQANIRLVISIVKKYATPQYTFDELLSEGIVTLIAAATKFDYDRGFRFSTYAYRSIARAAFRKVNQRKEEADRFLNDEDATARIADPGSTASMDESTWDRLRSQLARFLGKLDPRERLIVRARYALGKQRQIQTFQSLADQLGVSKERVRQLEQRAVSKLRKMAGAVSAANQ